MLGSECGYTPTEIRAMTLSDVGLIFEHWKRFPPLRWWVAGCAQALGVKFEPPESKPKPMTYEEARRFWAQTQGRIEGVGQHRG